MQEATSRAREGTYTDSEQKQFLEKSLFYSIPWSMGGSLWKKDRHELLKAFYDENEPEEELEDILPKISEEELDFTD